MNRTTIAVAAIGAAVVFGAGAGALIARQHAGGVQTAAAAPVPAAKKTPANTPVSVNIKPDDRVEGSPNAPVTIVEYASMTCPHCANFDRNVVPQLDKDYIATGKVRYVFREYPLDPAATMASTLARCETGDKYFSFVDLLFRNQDKWFVKWFANNQRPTEKDIRGSLIAMAKMAGMNQATAEKCLDSKENMNAVLANWQEGRDRYHVKGTPTFVINGRIVPYELEYQGLKNIIDPLLAGK